MPEKKIESEDTPTKTKKLPVKWILLGIVALAIIAGALLGYLLLKKSPEEAAQRDSSVASANKSSSSQKGFPHIFPIERFIVNLNDPGGKRYLKTTIVLESSINGFSENLEAQMPLVRDAVLLILSGKSIAAVQGIDGKISLRKELILTINNILKTTKIRNLYFTEFVIQ